MAKLTDLPNELLLAILEQNRVNIPNRLSNKTSWPSFLEEYAVTRRISRMAQYAFFLTYQHQVCIRNGALGRPSRRERRLPWKVYKSHGLQRTDSAFCVQVCRIRIKLKILFEVVDTSPAIEELIEELRRYPKVNEVEVVVMAMDAVAVETTLISALVEYGKGLKRSIQIAVRMHKKLHPHTRLVSRALCVSLSRLTISAPAVATQARPGQHSETTERRSIYSQSGAQGSGSQTISSVRLLRELPTVAARRALAESIEKFIGSSSLSSSISDSRLPVLYTGHSGRDCVLLGCGHCLACVLAIKRSFFVNRSTNYFGWARIDERCTCEMLLVD